MPVYIIKQVPVNPTEKIVEKIIYVEVPVENIVEKIVYVEMPAKEKLIEIPVIVVQEVVK